jgi:hypothetical protein
LAFLSQLLLTNFRSFPTAELDLDDHGLTLIAGANNSGKSALLSAFDLIAGRGAPGEYKYAGAPEVEVAATFTLSEDDQREIFTKNGIQATAAPWPMKVQWLFTDIQSALAATKLRVQWGHSNPFDVAAWEVGDQRFRLYAARP